MSFIRGITQIRTFLIKINNVDKIYPKIVAVTPNIPNVTKTISYFKREIQLWSTAKLRALQNNNIHEEKEEIMWKTNVRNKISSNCVNNEEDNENEIEQNCVKIMFKQFSHLVNKIFKRFSMINRNVLNKVKCRSWSRRGGWGGTKFFNTKIQLKLILNLKSILSVIIMISITIYLLLLCQGVESNPGPPLSTEILTYNCNGLGDQKKLRRLLNKVDRKVKRGAIICLQETHIVNTNYLDSIWKNKYLSNGIRTNAAGVMILFGEQYDVKYEYKGNDGRLIIAVLTYDKKNIIISNAYFPNDHKEGVNFAEDMYRRILEVQVDYPENLTICAGDYNVCLDREDSIGRVGSHNEEILAEVIRNNNEVVEICDAYRTIHKKEGFTWNRGRIFSRLDYVFISICEANKILEAKTDWAFESSDHAAVSIHIQKEEMKKGPGITKVNVEILEDPRMVEEITKEVKEMMEQTDDSWNPHAILEFLKVVIRSTIATKVSERRKQTTNILSEKEEELNQMELIKIKICTNKAILEEDKSLRVNIVNTAIENLKSCVQVLRRELTRKLTFYSQAKWFEFGEKSNKFFLNLNKSRQAQKLINKISDGKKDHFGHEQVLNGITNFYKNLYEKIQINKEDNDRSFYDNCPKLSVNHKEFMEKDINLDELKKALWTCKDSSPGPDGIPYSVYKKLWSITGPIILNSWLYSLQIGTLPPSHLESAITLLPKEGKDVGDIKNWRPITLSNCDAKIITKAIAIKTSKVIDTIIDISQTAYVPGRSITDNLRSNSFYKNYCKKNNVDAVLISLDAKKAFDSVDHKYIEETLEAYGFGPAFIKTFRTLYKDITARVLVNGFTSEKIKIGRGVKQGDALSCALFIICIDPLLRNINKNENIKQVKISRRNEIKKKIDLKAAAYADDISVICKKDNNSIQNVFHEYERLTRLSGLELNAEKTEILILNKSAPEFFTIKYNSLTVNIESVLKLKICGIYFCDDTKAEYKLNVLDKIEKLTYKIKSWIPRHLTLEGKSLIVKTYGLSQIIYNMQACAFEDPEIIMIERIIFKFLWSTTENHDGIDRIKRSIMKNDYEHAGMKITDVECLNRSLKLRQFMRAQKSNHVIARIQNLLSKNDETSFSTHQEYSKITKEEPICQSAQESLNLITDYNREQYERITEEEFETNKHLINEISSINLVDYFNRKRHIFMACMLKPLTVKGITTLGELVQNFEFETEDKTLKTMKIIMQTFPKKLIQISKCFIEDINDNDENLKFIRIEDNTWKSIECITVKDLQITLKKILKKTETTNFNQKLGIQNFKEDNIIKLRSKCQNAKFRNLYFRLIHNDFFTHVRMKKYKMTQTDCCPRCGNMETARHLLFDCSHARNIWDNYNEIVIEDKVITYEDLIQVNDSQAAIMIKMKLIQELIQIERPKNWNKERIIGVIENLIEIERYNAIKNKNIHKFKKIWNKYEKLTMKKDGKLPDQT
jgi:hypothetical protein